MALVLLQQAKDHLRITTSESDVDIQLKMDHASSIVLDYLKDRAGASWTWQTVPAPVQAATLLMLGHLYEHRGDDAAGTFRTPDSGIWEAVERLLIRFRDPALA